MVDSFFPKIFFISRIKKKGILEGGTVNGANLSLYKDDKMKNFLPNEIVKSCDYLERGLSFQLRGLCACTTATKSSPILATTDELKNQTATYDKIVQRRMEIFEAMNGLRDMDIEGCKDCANICQKPYKDVNFEWGGGKNLPAGFSIQHYTMCNERCHYCCYAQNNEFYPPQYDILYVYELFRKQGRLGRNNWIDLSGGEPALLKNFDEILKYMMSNNMGTVVVYSNCSIFSPVLFEGLRNNKIILTTSLDTGLRSTYARLRGRDYFEKVVDNLIRYRNSGTKNLWLKYVITDENRTEDDLWSFVFVMLAIHPNSVMISPDFPYGDKQIPEETVKFAAKLWYMLETYMPDSWLQDYTSAFGDKKFIQYREAMFAELERLKSSDVKHMNDIIDAIPNTERIAIWGAGGMAKKLLDETNLVKKHIVRVYDSSKTERKFLELNVKQFDPRDIESGDVESIVITSRRFQSEILHNLKPYKDKVKIIKLFDRQLELYR